MTFDIIAMGSSLGGLDALTQILGALPADFPAAITVVQHLHLQNSFFVSLLQRQTTLSVCWAVSGEPVEPGTVYVARPNQHLEVTPTHQLMLSDRTKVSFARPSVDVLFASVAATFGSRAIGVILTGRLYDGRSGIQAIKATGGRTIVQDPRTAQANNMPRAALLSGAADFMLPLHQIAPALITLTMVKGATALFPGAMPAACFTEI